MLVATVPVFDFTLFTQFAMAPDLFPSATPKSCKRNVLPARFLRNYPSRPVPALDPDVTWMPSSALTVVTLTPGSRFPAPNQYTPDASVWALQPIFFRSLPSAPQRPRRPPLAARDSRRRSTPAPAGPVCRGTARAAACGAVRGDSRMQHGGIITCSLLRVRENIRL
jgi:hypothetical protein